MRYYCEKLNTPVTKKKTGCGLPDLLGTLYVYWLWHDICVPQYDACNELSFTMVVDDGLESIWHKDIWTYCNAVVRFMYTSSVQRNVPGQAETRLQAWHVAHDAEISTLPLSHTRIAVVNNFCV